MADEDIPEELPGQRGRRFFKKASEWIESEAPKLYVVEEDVADRWLASHPKARLPMRVEESKQNAATKRARRSPLRAALARAEHQGR